MWVEDDGKEEKQSTPHCLDEEDEENHMESYHRRFWIKST